MRTYLLAGIFLALGVGVGIYHSSREFAGEVLPTKAVLQYLNQRQSPQMDRSGPRLVVVGGETHDFGKLSLWSKGEHTFVLRNEGTQTLRLVMGQPTCSCTLGSSGGVALEKGSVLEVEPGRELPLTLSWEIKSSMENFNQSAPFETNDPDRKSLVLAIVGKVEEAIHLSRSAVVFNNVSMSETITQMVRVETDQAKTLTVTNHRWLDAGTAGFFDFKIVPGDSPEAGSSSGKVGFSVAISIKPGLPLGSFSQTLELTTNMAPAIPPIKIPIQGTVVGDLSVIGQGVNSRAGTLALGVVPQGRGMKRTIHVVVKGPHRDETKVSVASSSPANLQVQIGEPDTSNPRIRLYPVTLEVPADSPPVNFSAESGRTGEVVLETTHPQIKQIELKVMYIVRD